MAERYLDRYRDEIIQLHRQRYTQARIRRHLEETYTIDVPKTTLSNFMQELRSAGLIGTAAEPRVTPEEEQFLAQYEVFQKLEQSSQQVLDAASQVLARLVVLEDAARERHDAMLATVRRLEETPRSATPDPSPSWLRALLITGAFWAVLVVIGAALYYAPWR